MNRLPFAIAGVVLAIFFGFHGFTLLTREPAHLQEVPGVEDYPLEIGLTWVYESGPGLQVVRKVVSGTPEHLRWYSMQFDLPLLGRKTLLMRRSRDGVLARRDNVEQTIMRFPMRPGDGWTIDFPNEDLAECTVLQPEEIDVLSTKAMASKVRVVRTNRKTGKKTTDHEWYVRGIGLAKMEVTFGLKATFHLIRFERAAASEGIPAIPKK